MGGASARLGYGVVAVTTPGVAAADATKGEPGAPHGTVRLEGLQPVGRTGGEVTAGRKAGANLSHPAVETDGARQDPGGRAHDRLATARSWPIAASISAKGAAAAAGTAPHRGGPPRG